MLDKGLLKDVAERALWTAAQAFVAVYTVGGVDEAKSALTAAVAAGISVVKGFMATQVGNPKSASTLKN
jgi:hypothetical protein